MKQRVVITGATGFIGKNLCRLMSEYGDFEIAVIVRDSNRLESDLPISQFYELTSSFEDLNQFIKNFQPEAIVHLASLFIANHQSNDISPLIRSNIEFGTMLLEAAYRSGHVKYFINIGSSWQTAVSDSSDYHPMDLYAATKQAFEDILAFYCDLCGIKSTTLRLFDTYGEGDTRRKLLQLLAQTLKTGESLAMSPGDQQIDLVHVSDVCKAILMALKKLQTGELADGQVYGIRSGQPVSLKGLTALIEAETGKKLNILWGGRPYRQNEIMKSNTALPSLPGWKAEISLQDGLKRYFHSL
ncbi:MAG: NAD-dependent epimerase/dehydratase family protein [Lentisphaeria bacterium]|nr:NAD-dependent epimerase/dehydratase family protein [Lentisphaeria bacterium]